MSFIRYFLVSVLCLLTGIVYSRELPKVKNWILLKIQIVSSEEAHVEVKAQSIDFSFFPPGVDLHKLKVTPHGKIATSLAPTTIDLLGIYLSPASLLAGRFEIGSITIDHPVTSVFIRDNKNKSGGKPAGSAEPNEIFEQIIDIPLRKLTVTNAEIRAKIEPADLLVQLTHFSLKADKTYKAAQADIFAPNLELVKISTPNSLVTLGVATRIIVENNAAEIAALKITQGSNFLMAQGVGHGNTTTLDFPFISGRTVAHMDVNEIAGLAKIFFPTLNLPNISGSLNVELTADRQRGKDVQMAAQIETRDARLNKFKLGNIFSKINLNGNIIKAQEIKVDNPGSSFKIENLQVNLGKETTLSGRLAVNHIELKQFLNDIDIDAPLHMDITGSVPCEGTVNPELRIECAGEIRGSNFVIHSKDTKKTIVALKEFKLTSSLVAQKDKILFPNGILSFGSTTGRASGIVDYDKGFLFNYHSDHLDFQDLASLADLKYQGALSITGTTSGNGHTGVMNAQVAAKNMWFENYGLGDVDMNVAYERGYLKFTQIRGQVGNTNYNGQTIVQVDDSVGNHKTGISSAHLELPQLDLVDVTQGIFARRLNLPIATSGLGFAKIDASGPFSLSQLNYKLQAVTYHGSIAGESYKEAHFNIHGVDGHAFADDVILKKGEGQFSLTGDVLNTGIMNVAVQGGGLRLSDFEHVRSLLGDLDGHLTTNMTLKGFILKPQVALKGAITQTTLNQQILEDSTFSINFEENGMSLDGQLFNQKLITHLQYPFSENRPFSFKFETANWDFTNLLGVLGKSATRDYETSLSAKINLSSPDGAFWHSTGEATIDKLYVRHGTAQLKNALPIAVKFDDGFVNINQFKILGDDTELQVTGNKSRKDALNFNISGRVNLNLLTFLTPFFRDMGGELSLSTQVGGTLAHPDLLGSAYLKRGYFRLMALSQPFEDVSADLLFSQQRILINRLSAHLGGGTLSAGGSLGFKALGDVPVEIAGDLANGTLNVPDGLLTHGDFHFAVTGSWFPYLLKGDYNIESGLYSKNFGDDYADAELKRSVYLPKVILQKNFSSIELDVTSHFQKGLTIKNELLEADVKGDLEVKGDPSHPIFKGDIVAVPGGKILFHETPFNITECSVKFNNPTENNPQIYAQGTTHVRDWDIGLLVQGTKQKYKIELTSTPSLPEKSIISLLALGVTEDDEAKAQQSSLQNLAGLNNPAVAQANTATVQASQAGNLLLGTTINNELKKKFGINVRLSQDVDETRNIVMPRVIAEKVWSPKITTSVSHTLGEYVTRDANVEYKLNRHFSLLGSYEGRDYDPMSLSGPTAAAATLTSQDIFGLDLQYQVEFK